MNKKKFIIAVLIILGIGVVLYYSVGSINQKYFTGGGPMKMMTPDDALLMEALSEEPNIDKDIKPYCTKLPDGWKLEYNTIIKEYRICAPHRDCTAQLMFHTKQMAIEEACKLHEFGIKAGYFEDGWVKDN